MRPIDGDALEKYLSDAEIEAIRQRKYVFASALNTICGNVRNFPTIEPERKKGKWIDDCECSSCHWINEDDEGHVLLTYYNFCPNCGEPMENGEKDEQF